MLQLGAGSRTRGANRRPRKRRVVPVATFVLILLTAAVAAARTVYNPACTNNEGSPHCEAITTEGLGSDGSQTLTNVTSATAVLEALCQRPWATDTDNTTINGLWLSTPRNPSGPAYLASGWHPEWLESGLRTGYIGGTKYGLSFYWARDYWAPTYGRYLYNEYHLSGSPATYTNYTWQTRWLAASSVWQILRDGASVITGIQSQQPPGSHQALEAGAEMTRLHDDERGWSSTLSYVAGGVSHTGFLGNLFVSNPPFSTVNYGDTFIYFDSSCT
jgi:hypothetical protein